VNGQFSEYCELSFFIAKIRIEKLTENFGGGYNTNCILMPLLKTQHQMMIQRMWRTKDKFDEVLNGLYGKKIIRIKSIS